jgi:putative restriction endonuclease
VKPIWEAAGVVDLAFELDVRQRAITYVTDLATRNGGVVTRPELEAFTLPTGEQLKLIDQSRGIRNPRQLDATLSILSRPGSPYDDVPTDDGLLHYAYRSGDVDSGDNRKLRRAVELQVPVILLEGISAGVFVPIAPVYLVADDPVQRYVAVAPGDELRLLSGVTLDGDQRRYVQRLTRMRLHQPVFRARVIQAYETQCSVCRLRHGDLLDAAHIRDDAEGGQPVIPNGMAMCKIHHAAFDRNILAITPDYRIEISESVLREVDGPMLRHGLQDVHGWHLNVPKRVADLPDREALAARYTRARVSQ